MLKSKAKSPGLLPMKGLALSVPEIRKSFMAAMESRYGLTSRECAELWVAILSRRPVIQAMARQTRRIMEGPPKRVRNVGKMMLEAVGGVKK